MPHGSRRPRPCPCGRADISGVQWLKGKRTCWICGTERSVTNAIDMSQKRGVGYERWQRSNADGATGAPADGKD